MLPNSEVHSVRAHLAGEQGTLFEDRFLGRYAGAIMSDPTTALVELVANAWDAYATEVVIVWPEKHTGTKFSIADNGIGMTAAEFEKRWRTLDYDRLAHQGGVVQPPTDLQGELPRSVYGRNGRGRHAAFLFSSPYQVVTWRDGLEVTYNVSQGLANPIEVLQVGSRSAVSGHGTEVKALDCVPSVMDADKARSILSTRFLMEPKFNVYVNSIKVTFSDIPVENLQHIEVDVGGFGTARVMVIDSTRADRTTKQHGVAWWVKRRLVGEGGWNVFDERVIDGRTEEAKRYTFIVEADFLEDAVLPDWSDFKQTEPSWQTAQPLVLKAIRQAILSITKERREKSKDEIRDRFTEEVKVLPIISRERWNEFLDEIVDQCPNLTEAEMGHVMGILAKLEASNSQYSLLKKLHDLTPDELDDWNTLLEQWSVSTAKEALDEIAKRLKIIEEIKVKTRSIKTDEVKELQPLIGQALWIFGPQFESIEFTSNRGMTTVIRQLMGGVEKGSLNRPDFIVLPDSSVGFYSRPSFDGEFNEDGCDTLVVIELKRPGVPLGSAEKEQVWKYVKELRSKGYIRADKTHVKGFVLGDRIAEEENEPRQIGDNCVIKPLLFSSFVGQAEKRMLNLHKKLIEAPFMKAVIADLESQEDSTLEVQPELEVSKVQPG